MNAWEYLSNCFHHFAEWFRSVISIIGIFLLAGMSFVFLNPIDMHLQSGLFLVINLSLNQAQQYFSLEWSWSGSKASASAKLANFDLM